MTQELLLNCSASWHNQLKSCQNADYFRMCSYVNYSSNCKSSKFADISIGIISLSVGHRKGLVELTTHVERRRHEKREHKSNNEAILLCLSNLLRLYAKTRNGLLLSNQRKTWISGPRFLILLSGFLRARSEEKKRPHEATFGPHAKQKT